MALAEIEDAIEHAQQRIEFVRTEQNSDAEFLLQRTGELDNGALMMGIQADQRFIQQQQARSPEQRLREEETLALAT